jgi:uncharacterized protein (DUF1697 family)
MKRGDRAQTTTVVALLRGINVGGKNMLPMKDLAALFVTSGCADVTTYIQSGNVVCKVPATGVAGLAAGVEAAIRKRFSLEVPIVLRTSAEVAEVAQANPFASADEDQLYVAFLKDRPTAKAIAALDPQRSPPDEFAVVGREVYLRLPNGAGRTKITNAYLDRTLGTVSTARNWRTVRKLVELSR